MSTKLSCVYDNYIILRGKQLHTLWGTTKDCRSRRYCEAWNFKHFCKLTLSPLNNMQSFTQACMKSTCNPASIKACLASQWDPIITFVFGNKYSLRNLHIPNTMVRQSFIIYGHVSNYNQTNKKSLSGVLVIMCSTHHTMIFVIALGHMIYSIGCFFGQNNYFILQLFITKNIIVIFPIFETYDTYCYMVSKPMCVLST